GWGRTASECLGTRMDRITVHFGDSSLTPLAGTTTATRQLLMSGNATYEACVLLRDGVLGAVAEATGQPAGGLRLEPGKVTAEGVEMDPRGAPVTCRRRHVPMRAAGAFFGPDG